MNPSVQQLLNQVAKRGSWYGGGSAAALACALAAALLEKLTNGSPAARSSRQMRSRCTPLIERDAKAFSRVIQAYYQQDRSAARRALKAAIDIPITVYTSSQQVLALGQKARRMIRPKFRSDLTCVLALAEASRQASLALIETNLAWLGDRAYSRRVKQQLRKPP